MLIIRDSRLIELLVALYHRWYRCSIYDSPVKLLYSLAEVHKLALENFDPRGLAAVILSELYLDLKESFHWYDVEHDSFTSGSGTREAFLDDMSRYLDEYRCVVAQHVKSIQGTRSGVRYLDGPVRLLEILEDGSLVLSC